MAIRIQAGEVKGMINLVQHDSSEKNWVPAKSNAGAVAYITGFEEKPEIKKTIQSLLQKNKEFSPRVLVVTAGEEVSFPNEDNIYHNVWSLSKTKTFDLGSYKAPESKKLSFEKPGLVNVFCNIHPQMIATVLVLKNKKYFVTDKTGNFSIKDIPPGNHQLRIWVEGADPIVKEIQVTDSSVFSDSFTLKVPPAAVEHLNKMGKPYSQYSEY